MIDSYIGLAICFKTACDCPLEHKPTNVAAAHAEPTPGPDPSSHVLFNWEFKLLNSDASLRPRQRWWMFAKKNTAEDYEKFCFLKKRGSSLPFPLKNVELLLYKIRI